MTEEERTMGRLDGSVTLVTGGARGNGRAICERFAEEGATVVVADVDRRGGEQTAAELAGRFEYLDVADEANVRDVIDRTVEQFGRLDVLVSNAGIQEQMQNVDELSIDDWDRVIGVNLTGVFLCMKHALRHMKQQGSGSIINMSSGGAGINAFPGVPAYAASKGGVTVLTKGAALEVADQGIRVNAVCPGMIDTPMMSNIVDQLDAQGLDGQHFVDHVQPNNRLGTPREIANAVLFLASDEASLITGIPLLVDGGMNAGTRKPLQ